MEGGELFQRIQEKQAFNERGKKTIKKLNEKHLTKINKHTFLINFRGGWTNERYLHRSEISTWYECSTPRLKTWKSPLLQKRYVNKTEIFFDLEQHDLPYSLG